jgi:phenylalanyl-tRNA synthetase alpha chain
MDRTVMSPERLKASLAIPDLTDSQSCIHAVNIIVGQIKNALKKAYEAFLFEEIRRSPLVSVKENFDDLLFPAENLGRSSRYTRYADEQTVLRTHTSSAVPDWLKSIVKRDIRQAIAMFPGICYRRDVVDKKHCGEPHQMDVWIIKDKHPHFGRKDLIDLVETVINCVHPGSEYRANEAIHPYTINGLEVEVRFRNDWLELLECGEVHPRILEDAGLDPNIFSGLALGMGLDRLVMQIKDVDDIRLLRSSDPRISAQMKNLETYIPVSRFPPIRQDLSVSVSQGTTEEDICERIRDTLGKNADVLEEISIISETAYDELPSKAIERLGITANQKNLLVRVILRSHERSLTYEEANEIRNTIYRSIDESTTGGYLTYKE